MLLVIFGAGASYDSVADYPPPPNPRNFTGHPKYPLQVGGQSNREDYRPPLANHLFDNRPNFVRGMTKYPECAQLIPSLHGGIDVEHRLAKLYERAASNNDVHRGLAAIIFYMQFILWDCIEQWHHAHYGANNYADILHELQSWHVRTKQDVCFVTFNYDRMLDQAMETLLRASFSSFDSYVSNPNYKLIKLHGSVDWAREVPQHIAEGGPSRIIAAAPIAHFGPFRKIQSSEALLQGGGGYGYPAMAIPVDNKDEFACPPKHVEELEKELPKIKKIITVGWRAREKSFMDMLHKRRDNWSANDAHWLVVSGDKDGAIETYQNLSVMSAGREPIFDLNDSKLEAYSNAQWAVADGFSGLMRNRSMLETFLSK